MNNEITYSIATPEDAHEITLVRRKTWLITYPNDKEGITREDIEEALNKRLIEDETNKTRERITTDKGSHSWVAKDNEAVVGFVSVRNDSIRNWIAAFPLVLLLQLAYKSFLFLYHVQH